jgi:hypothetical protein
MYSASGRPVVLHLLSLCLLLQAESGSAFAPPDKDLVITSFNDTPLDVPIHLPRDSHVEWISLSKEGARQIEGIYHVQSALNWPETYAFYRRKYPKAEWLKPFISKERAYYWARVNSQNRTKSKRVFTIIIHRQPTATSQGKGSTADSLPAMIDVGITLPSKSLTRANGLILPLPK